MINSVSDDKGRGNGIALCCLEACCHPFRLDFTSCFGGNLQVGTQDEECLQWKVVIQQLVLQGSDGYCGVSVEKTSFADF